MTLDHCKALDYLLADQGGICPPTISCCFYVNTSGQIKESTSQLPEKTTCRQRQISYDITYTWNLKKQYKWTYLPKRNRVTDVENELMVTRGVGRKGQIGRLGLTYINYYIRIQPLCNPMNCSPPGSSAYGDSPGKPIQYCKKKTTQLKKKKEYLSGLPCPPPVDLPNPGI